MLEAMKVMGLSETVEDRTKHGGGTKDTSAAKCEGGRDATENTLSTR